jgi:uncharacterized protein (DUF1330 family)
MTLVARLTVRREAIDDFRRFERAAAATIARHGGAIERVVVVRSAEEDELFTEIHLVTFPDDQAFEAYRGDPETVALTAVREACLVATEILFGDDGPDYHR